MTGPLVVLAALSALGGLLLAGHWIVDWLQPVVGTAAHEEPPFPTLVMSLLIVAVVAAGVAIAWFTVGTQEVPRTAPANVSFVTRAARADLYGDAFNEAVLMRPGDRMVNSLISIDDNVLDTFVDGTALASGGISLVLRRVQTGFVRTYALSVLGGAALVVLALLAVNLT
jgi:NADH-quinone oxidoreductase subunit L